MAKNKEIDLMLDKVLKNVESIIDLETQQKKNVPIHQRSLETVAAAFGQPWFLYAEVYFFSVWSFCSYLSDIGILSSNFPKFNLSS